MSNNREFFMRASDLLINAIKNNKLQVVMSLLPNVDINREYASGYTSLHYAVSTEYFDIVAQLLNQESIDVNKKSKDKDGVAPLHIAAKFNRTDNVDSLLKQSKIDVNKKDNDGYTPLHMAVWWGRADSVKLLLQHPKVNVNAQDNYGKTPLHHAMLFGYSEIVKLLLTKSTVDVNMRDNIGRTPLHSGVSHSAFYEDASILETFLKMKNFDINTKDTNKRTPLHVAARSANAEVLNILLANGADINAENINKQTPVHVAAIHGDENDLKILLANQAVDVNAQDIEGLTPLHYAARDGYAAIVVPFLNHANINVNTKSNDNTMPLGYALIGGEVEVVNELLNHANVDVNNKAPRVTSSDERSTCLYHAIEWGHRDIAKSLINHVKIDVNAKHAEGYTPLQAATRKGYVEISKMLLAKQAIDINAQSTYGHTAFFTAVTRLYEWGPNYTIWRNFYKIIKALLIHGASVSDYYEFKINGEKERTTLVNFMVNKNTGKAGEEKKLYDNVLNLIKGCAQIVTKGPSYFKEKKIDNEAMRIIFLHLMNRQYQSNAYASMKVAVCIFKTYIKDNRAAVLEKILDINYEKSEDVKKWLCLNRSLHNRMLDFFEPSGGAKKHSNPVGLLSNLSLEVSIHILSFCDPSIVIPFQKKQAIKRLRDFHEDSSNNISGLNNGSASLEFKISLAP
jgi:ankyrin repeat protein